MSFDVAAEAYAAFMGRYAEPLADELLALLDPQPGARALDVGAGTGALTARLAAVLGEEAVAAVEPMPAFVEHLGRRLPGVDVRQGRAEQLPYDDGAFDLTAAQLVVHFMADPVAGLREMARVTRPGGRVAASVWDHAGGRGALAPFWTVARELFPDTATESAGAGSRAGHLAELFEQAGIEVTDDTELTVTVGHDSFDQWWAPYTAGVGPAGDFVRSLSDTDLDRLRAACRDRLGDRLEVAATAWTVLGRA